MNPVRDNKGLFANHYLTFLAIRNISNGMKPVMKSLFILTLFFLAQGASASILINEIMYDLEGTDTDREWIEVYNDGNESVDLSGYKLFEGGVNHGLVLDTGNTTVPKSGYAIIALNPAKFKTDWPNFTGSIFDSSFSLSNESESLAIKNSDLELSDEYTYTSTTGGAGDGKSLQKFAGSWTAISPTPGASNTGTLTQNDSGTDTTSQGNFEQNNSGGNGTITPSATSLVSSRKINTKVNYNDFIFSGIPVLFEATTLGLSDERLIYGKYVWNFGDGMSLESKAVDSSAISHVYYYPNDYVLTLEYYSNEYLWKPDAIFQTIVKVLPASVYISNTGNASDFFVELTNNSKYDVDVSLWRIIYGAEYFTLPKNTIILKNQKISYSPKITNFTYSESKDFALYNANSDLIFDYEENIAPKFETKIVTKKSTARNSSMVASAPTGGEIFKRDDKLIEDNKPTNESLVARASASLPEGYSKNSFVYGLGLFLLLGISGSSVFFLRRSKRLGREDDFEVIDE